MCRSDPEIYLVKSCLSTLFTDLDGAHTVGKAYLDTYPEEGDRRFLMDKLFGSIKLCGPGDFRCRLAKRRTQDFREGEVVLIQGWILAKTEARIAALTVLI